jgi:hypothetical protein
MSASGVVLTWLDVLQNPISNIVKWAGQTLGFDPIAVFQVFISYVMDPTTTINAAVWLFGLLMQGIGTLIGPPVGEQFMAMGSKLQDIPMRAAWEVMGYLVSPVIDPALLGACIAISIDAWLFSLTLKLVIYIKGHFWSASA